MPLMTPQEPNQNVEAAPNTHPGDGGLISSSMLGAAGTEAEAQAKADAAAAGAAGAAGTVEAAGKLRAETGALSPLVRLRRLEIVVDRILEKVGSSYSSPISPEDAAELREFLKSGDIDDEGDEDDE